MGKSLPKHSLRQKVKRLRQINREAGSVIVDAFLEKLRLVYQKPTVVLKYFLETVFVFLIAIGIVLYFDSGVNLIPSPVNWIVFTFLVVIYLYVHFILHLPTNQQR